MYILECRDGSYYTGSTQNLELRFEQHQKGEGANHTKKRLPLKLVYFEEFDRIDEAFYREKQVQGWSRAKKEALINKMPKKLHELAQCMNDSHYKNTGLDSAGFDSAGFDSAQPAGSKSASIHRCLSVAEGNIPKHPAYKDSGLEWLGEIPKDWKVLRLNQLFAERKTQVSDKEYLPLSVTKIGIKPQLEHAAKTKDGDNRKLVKDGDFVINSRSDRKGSSGVSSLNGSVSLINIVITPKGLDKFFCGYLLKSNSFVEEFYRNGHGIVADLWTTRFAEMKNIKIPKPPLPTQTAIASFLDRKTKLIDKAVANKEKLIALLKERKQIIIQQAVTCGLDENGKLRTPPETLPAKGWKDSGVDWLGEIPEEWEVLRLKYILNLTNDKELSRDSSMVYVGMENIESNTGRFIHTSSKVEGLANRFQEKDILFGKLRPYLAKVYLAEFNGLCSTEFLVYRTKNPSYFQKLMLSNAFISMINSSTYGAKMPRASSEWIGNRLITVPPQTEQNEIVTYIETQYAKIDKAIAIQQNQIEKLKEYKAVLIDSAVTGKIKVS